MASNFKKLALATFVSGVFGPLRSYAMEEVPDDFLSESFAQAGISTALNIAAAGILTNVYIHDRDGLGSAPTSQSYSFAGAIVIDQMKVAVGGANIVINIDAGDNQKSAGTPILNINVALPALLTISTGAVRVANSNRDDAGASPNFTGSWDFSTVSGVILNSMDITLGNTTLNIQLGNERQTGSTSGSDMAVLNSLSSGGILISGFRLNDASGGSAFGIGGSTITIIDNGAANLTLLVDVNVVSSGLVLGLGQIGSAATGVDIRTTDLYLGTSTNAKIGDFSIVGLSVNGSTLTISGK